MMKCKAVSRRPDRAEAIVSAIMKNGAVSTNVTSTVADVRDFFRRRRQDIVQIQVKIGLTNYFWKKSTGWEQENAR